MEDIHIDRRYRYWTGDIHIGRRIYIPDSRYRYPTGDIHIRRDIHIVWEICDRICENRPPCKICTLEIRAFEHGHVVLDPNFFY